MGILEEVWKWEELSIHSEWMKWPDGVALDDPYGSWYSVILWLMCSNAAQDRHLNCTSIFGSSHLKAYVKPLFKRRFTLKSFRIITNCCWFHQLLIFLLEVLNMCQSNRILKPKCSGTWSVTVGTHSLRKDSIPMYLINGQPCSDRCFEQNIPFTIFNMGKSVHERQPHKALRRWISHQCV